MLPLLHESHQGVNLIFAMARTTQVPSARTAHTQGRGAASQSEAGGWPTSTQGGTEGPGIKEERREEEGSEESEEDKDCNREDKGSKSNSSEGSEMEEPTKPPAKTQASTQPSEDHIDEGKEGMADDDESSPCNVEACCKVREKGECPHKGSTIECRVEHLASQTVRATGDFGTPEIASARLYMLRYIGPWSPGCLVPWAWLMTL